MMKVVSIQLKEKSGGWKQFRCIQVNPSELRAHGKPAISLISEKVFQEAKMSQEKGFCHNRFKPNIIISMTYEEERLVKKNAKLDIGNVKLFVLDKNHCCHVNCPLLPKKNHYCQWTEQIHFADIVHEGSFCQEDLVYISHT